MPDISTVTAVISSFNPPDDLVERTVRLSDQVDRIIVVDDGSGAGSAGVLEALRENGVEVIAPGINRGIAAALNTGIRRARELEADVVLTLDQDSEIDPGYVARALETYREARRKGVPVGIICAESHNGLPVMLQEKGVAFPEAFDPMQSGTLIPESTLSSVGLFEESLFIDCVDSEYTARLRQAGLRAVIADGCNIKHAVGESRPMRLGTWHVSVAGQKRYVHSHAPFRVYYIARNGVVLYGRYARKQPRWVMRRIGLELVFYAIRVLYGPYRGRQVLAIGIGLVDALRGRMGRLTPHQEALVRPRSRNRAR